MSATTRRPTDWLRLGMILTTGCAAVALWWTGMTIAGLGEERLGFGIAAVGAVVFLAVAQVDV